MKVFQDIAKEKFDGYKRKCIYCQKYFYVAPERKALLKCEYCRKVNLIKARE